MVKLGQRVDCCVVDEIQLIGDMGRGWAWTRALHGASVLGGVVCMHWVCVFGCECEEIACMLLQI